jgi:hypothetical protein
VDNDPPPEGRRWTCRDHPDGNLDCDLAPERFTLPEAYYAPVETTTGGKGRKKVA